MKVTIIPVIIKTKEGGETWTNQGVFVSDHWTCRHAPDVPRRVAYCGKTADEGVGFIVEHRLNDDEQKEVVKQVEALLGGSVDTEPLE